VASSSRPSRSRRSSRHSESGIIVRPAGLHDIETIVRFRIALLKEHAQNPIYGRLRDDAAERAHRTTPMYLASGREITWIAMDDKIPVGMLRCIEGRGSPLLRPARFGYIASVFVVASHRRRGILHQLVDAATVWCRARGIHEMRLHSTPENDAANAAWERLGFVTVEYLRRRETLIAPGS
jgi:GNAT superfamily N-acetyltransferase